MKLKNIYTLFFVLLISLGATAQANDDVSGGNKKQKIAAMKVAFITERLNLTPEEAQRFWPVYNQYQSKLDELRKKNRETIKQTRQDFDALSEKEVEVIIDGQIEFKQKELEIIKEMHAKLKTVLSPKKIAKLYGSEEQFKLKLLQMVKDRKNSK